MDLIKIKNVEKIEFLPFHHLGFSKYEELGIPNPLKDTPEMKPEEREKCYQKFMVKRMLINGMVKKFIIHMEI